MIVNHSVHLICAAVNVHISKQEVRREDLKYFIAFNLIYLAVNWYITIIDGPAYPFLTWKAEIKSVIPIIVLVIGQGLLYLGVSSVSRNFYSKDKQVQKSD